MLGKVIVSVVSSVLSLLVMGYVGLRTELGPWIGPLFSMAFVVMFAPILTQYFNKKYAVFAIAAGSLGGMVGIVLSYTVPSWLVLDDVSAKILFVYKRDMVLFWIGLILTAFVLATVVIVIIKRSIVDSSKSHLVMPQVVCTMLSSYDRRDRSAYWLMMLVGSFVAVWWNGLVWFARYFNVFIVRHTHMVPLLGVVGFISGHLIVAPIMVGFLTREVLLSFMVPFFNWYGHEKNILIMFGLGILLAVVVSELKNSIVRSVMYKNGLGFFKQYFWLLLLYYIIMIFVVLHSLHLVWYQAFVFSIVLVWLSSYVTRVFAQLGVVEVESFVAFVVVPLIYYCSVSLHVGLMVTMWVMLILGFMVDGIFSYSLSRKVGIAYKDLLFVQIIAIIAAALSCVCIMYAARSFVLSGDFSSITSIANRLDVFVILPQLNYKIIAIGLGYGLLLRCLMAEVMGVVGALLVEPVVSVTLLIFGSISRFFPNKKDWYPVLFGIYAAQLILMMSGLL